MNYELKNALINLHKQKQSGRFVNYLLESLKLVSLPFAPLLVVIVADAGIFVHINLHDDIMITDVTDAALLLVC